MKKALILLMGEQPAANLLPSLYVMPDLAIIVHTQRTELMAKNLKKVLETEMECMLCSTEPYKIYDIKNQINNYLIDFDSDYEMTFNLTGGTKPMVLGAFEVAKSRTSPFVYFQTEGNRSLLYFYDIEDGSIFYNEKVEIDQKISLKNYLGIYLNKYTTDDPRDEFEVEIEKILKDNNFIDEVMFSLRPKGRDALEVDFILRCGNQIGIGEIKRMGQKKGIDQLGAVAEQRHLGTYLKKFLISAQIVDDNNKNLAKAYNIQIIEIPGYLDYGIINEIEKQKILSTIKGEMC